MAEGGVPGYQAANWIGIVAPAGTPAPVVALLHKEISAIQDSPELRQRFTFEGADVLQMSVAEFGAFMVGEHAKWGRVIEDAKIKARVESRRPFPWRMTPTGRSFALLISSARRPRRRRPM